MTDIKKLHPHSFLPTTGLPAKRQGLFAGFKSSETPAADTVQLSQQSKSASPLKFSGSPFSWLKSGNLNLFNLRTLAGDTFSDLRRHDPDLDEFLDIINGETTEDYLIDQIINDKVQIGEDGSIIIDKPRINIPDIHHGNQPGGGVGSGEGEEGEPIDGEPPDGEGEGAGNNPGNPDLKPWQYKFSPSEIARLVGNQFGLPFMKPSDGESNRVRMTKDTTKVVPPGELHRKKTFRNAVKRGVGGAIATGNEPDFNNIYPERRDRVYKAIQYEPQPNLKVAVLYIADVSGSVDENLRTFTKNANRFVSYPLKYKYGLLAAELAGEDYNDADFFGKDGTEDGGLKENFIVYTTEANEVTEDEFYKTTQNGGTECASGFKKAQEIIDEKYPPSEGWNVYIYHYSDGDNWGDDSEKSEKAIKELLSSGVRYVGHVDLGNRNNMPSRFRKHIDNAFKENPHVGTIGIQQKTNYTLEDYKDVVGTFLPPQKEELEWYDTDAAV